MTKMQQMPLALKPPRRPSFENFIVGDNETLVNTLRIGLEASDWYLLIGPDGSGRSHLLSAVFQSELQLGKASVYVPLSEPSRWQLLDAVTASSVVIDDIDALAGDSAGEMRLFNALNRWRSDRTLVLMSASSLTDFRLPDLCSRLGQSTRLTLKPLDDSDLETLAVRLAQDQEMGLTAEVAKYLVSRTTRNARAVTDVMNQVMTLALSERRSITVPLIRTVLHSN